MRTLGLQGRRPPPFGARVTGKPSLTDKGRVADNPFSNHLTSFRCLERFSRFSHSHVQAKSLNQDIDRPSLRSLEMASKTMKREVVNVAHAMKKGLSTPV